TGARNIAKPEDIAALAVFLCSEKARQIQGVAVAGDGGGAPGLYWAGADRGEGTGGGGERKGRSGEEEECGGEPQPLFLLTNHHSLFAIRYSLFAALLRHRPVATDIDARRLERAVGFLDRAQDGERGSGLEVALVADGVADDRNPRAHHDLLLTALIA